MKTWEINGQTLEYIDGMHLYVLDGIIVPSITGILSKKFGRKYDGVDRAVLQRAADAGTAVHEAIEKLCKTGEVTDLPEVKNFLWLQKQYEFSVVDNEVPVILSIDGKPCAAGRLDMVLLMDGESGLADIKRTSVLDKEYVAYQLNLYRIAFQQSYGVEIKFLRALHLREDVRKFVKIPINENLALQLVKDYMEDRYE